MKLTVQDLAMFLGCEVDINNSVHTGTLIQVHKNSNVDHGVVKVTIGRNDHFYLPEEIKPILRPLSDITDEEFTELVILNWGISRDIAELKIKKIVRSVELKQASKFGASIPYSGFGEKGEHVITGTFSSRSLTPDQFKFLTSKQFDLFGWIEKGLALSTNIN